MKNTFLLFSLLLSLTAFGQKAKILALQQTVKELKRAYAQSLKQKDLAYDSLKSAYNSLSLSAEKHNLQQQNVLTGLQNNLKELTFKIEEADKHLNLAEQALKKERRKSRLQKIQIAVGTFTIGFLIGVLIH